jgi:hypothetical protein
MGGIIVFYILNAVWLLYFVEICYLSLSVVYIIAFTVCATHIFITHTCIQTSAPSGWVERRHFAPTCSNGSILTQIEIYGLKTVTKIN